MTTTILTAVLSLTCGIGIGILYMLASIRRSPIIEDTQRLQLLENLNWQLGSMNGKWGVLQNVDGKLMMIGHSHEKLRDAIDAAKELVTHG